MKTGFVIATLNDKGGYDGFYNGSNFEEQNVELAEILTEKTHARVALGNLQRANAEADLTIVPVEIRVTFLNSQAQT